MVESVERIGRFTSSNIWKLTTSGTKGNLFGAPALTYIDEKSAERYLGRSVDLGKDSQATIWGKIAEHFCNVFHLEMGYDLISSGTIIHPKYDFWSGSPDAKKVDTTGEIKCFEPKKYFALSMALLKLNEGTLTLEEFKELFKDVFWQVVSNSILLKTKYAEIIAFMPNESQLIEMRKQIEESNVLEKLGIDPWKARFIVESEIHHLPYVKNPNYPTCARFKFEPSMDDKIFLTKRVLDANKLLNEM